MELKSASTGAIRTEPILGSIVCTPAAATVGEAVRVEVRAPNGRAYNNNESSPISINGVPGSLQYLSWSETGSKRIVALARRGRSSEKMISSIQINPAAAGATPLPSIRVSWTPENPTLAKLSVVRPRSTPGAGRMRAPDAIGVAPTPPGPVAAPRATWEAVRPAAGKPTGLETVGATVTHVSSAPVSAAVSRFAGGGEGVPIYTWEFSDGLSLSTMGGTAVHDFGRHLDPDRPYSVFHITLTIQDPGKSPIIVRRSVTVWNHYNLMKRRGVLQPVLTSWDLNAKFSHGFWHASFDVYNPEPFDVTLTGRYIDLISDPAPSDGRQGLPPQVTSDMPGITGLQRAASTIPPGSEPNSVAADDLVAETAAGAAAHAVPRSPAQRVQLVLKAGSTTKMDVSVAREDLPKQVVAFVARFTGRSPQNLPVRVSAAFDIPEHLSEDRLVPLPVELLIDGLAARGFVADTGSVKSSQLSKLVNDGVIQAGALSSPEESSASHALHQRRGHNAPPPAKEGDDCDPENLPDVIPEGMFCMPTAETRRMKVPARFLNAKKGDIILTPGDGSLISDVLASVEPTQPYAHSGMMTRNHDEVTHSTGSMQRMTDHDSGFVGPGGFRPDILKYVWPGVITQSVQDAVDGEQLTDPETGKQYVVGGFGSLQTAEWLGKMSVAMVVKPDPLNETPEVRSQLNSIADFAAGKAGQSHYRFFCYSDPTIGLTQKAPSEAKWAAGTFPSVCSSLIWMSIQQSGAQMEGGLEPTDMDLGAQIAANTPDGLYLYQADERLNAGEVLFDAVGGLAVQAVGHGVAGIVDIEEDLGNQVVNTFASDWADSDAAESDKWRQTVDANAVSPQNLMFYDAPLYGYSEPLIYREERMEQVTVYRWQHVAQTGTVSGLIRWQGQPAVGVDVQITANLMTHTDGNGTFTLKAVPVGDVIVQAQKPINGVRMSGQATVHVVADKNTAVVIDLTPPPTVFRRVLIDGTLWTTDYEFQAAVDPYHRSDFNALGCLDRKNARQAVRRFGCVADNDAFGQLTLSFDLQRDDSVIVKSVIRCYDSDKADTDDYDEGALDPILLPAGHTSHWYIFVDGENYAEARFTLTNEVNPS